MIKCCDLLDLLVDFLDGDLDDDQRARIQNHLDWCKPCVEFLDSYKDTGTVCRDALVKEMPEEIKSRLFEVLRKELQSP